MKNQRRNDRNAISSVKGIAFFVICRIFVSFLLLKIFETLDKSYQVDFFYLPHTKTVNETNQNIKNGKTQVRRKER